MSHKPIGFYLIGVFLTLSIFILEASGLALLRSGTFLDALWSWQPQKYAQMWPWRYPVGVAFILLGFVFAATVFGWFKQLRWGWQLATVIFVVNGIGDAADLVKGDLKGGLTGVCMAMAIIFYLTRPQIRVLFTKNDFNHLIKKVV